MSFIKLEHNGPVSIITLDRPPMNLLDIETMDDLIAAHQEADAHPNTRVILLRSGVPRMFSNGLDPAYVLKRDEDGRVAVFRAVGRLLHHLFALGKPHVARLDGPAMAGGAILAITADYRMMSHSAGRISFSETKVGLPIPEAVSAVIGLYCRPDRMRDVVFGANLDAETALKAGLADGIADGKALDELVEIKIARLARLSPSVMRETKAGLRSRVKLLTQVFLDGIPSFDAFVGDAYLGEGLRALVEGRHPEFKR